MRKTSLKGLTKPEIKKFFYELNEQKFRASQVYNWIHNHLVDSVEEMQNLPKHLIAKIKEKVSLDVLRIENIAESQDSGTTKYLFRTYDDQLIETVFIPDETRNTVCLSTQVGCPLDCKFCATGLMGYKRNLFSDEIVDQYIQLAKIHGKDNISNIVYMGMGEPLINFKYTLKSLQIFTDEEHKGLSRNKITVSTAGIPERIKDLADSGFRVKLALSLHSCFDPLRSIIMPINDKYPIDSLLDSVKYYAQETQTRITFEYIMLDGFNDRDEDIKALAKICNEIPSKVNIIPFNSINHMFPDGISSELKPTPIERIYRFADDLREKNVTVMIRNTQGSDIAAACGQLAVKMDKPLSEPNQ